MLSMVWGGPSMFPPPATGGGVVLRVGMAPMDKTVEEKGRLLECLCVCVFAFFVVHDNLTSGAHGVAFVGAVAMCNPDTREGAFPGARGGATRGRCDHSPLFGVNDLPGRQLLGPC